VSVSFSVIVPTYNRPRLLLRCLRSLASLDYPREDFEVILANNGVGFPARHELASAAGDTRLTVISLNNVGPAAARNVAASRAAGEYLAFIDDDSAVATDWLQEMEHAVTVAPDALIGGRTLNDLQQNIFSEASQLLLEYLYLYYGGHAAGRRQFFASNNMAVSAKHFAEMLGFDGSFNRAAEDREFCERWQHRGRPFHFAAKAIVRHAHELDVRSFPRQHFNYGRSAFSFRRKCAENRSGRVRVEPLAFYVGMLRFPYRKDMRGAAGLSTLLAFSQLANAGGFFFEAAAGVAHSLAPGQLWRRFRRVRVADERDVLGES
jgi:GT2 family glycosyltransferase